MVCSPDLEGRFLLLRPFSTELFGAVSSPAHRSKETSETQWEENEQMVGAKGVNILYGE